MPSLQWNEKSLAPIQPARLELDSITHPDAASRMEAVPPNKLFLGDNLAIMAALLPDYEGRINLIYADPPFFTNRHFPARIGRGEDSRKPREWQLAAGYADHWDTADAYIDFLYQRLALMVRLLAPGGTLYLHLDWHADAYGRLLLDELLGADNFLNEIIWAYHGPSPIRSAFNRKHDTILVYTKGRAYTFNANDVRVPYDEATVKTFASSKKAGFGKVPDLKRGKVPEDWWYFPVVARLHSERTGYPTQKPEALLERIILASSNPGDLVADFFCGSGTTPLVAARLGRHFLAADATFRALHTARERLVRAASPSFAVYTSTSASQSVTDSPPFTFERAGAEIKLTSLELPAYWEIDPDWDGRVFCSRFQAVRPLRSGEIARHLPLLASPPGATVSIRMVTGSGEYFQMCLENK